MVYSKAGQEIAVRKINCAARLRKSAFDLVKSGYIKSDAYTMRVYKNICADASNNILLARHAKTYGMDAQYFHMLITLF